MSKKHSNAPAMSKQRKIKDVATAIVMQINDGWLTLDDMKQVMKMVEKKIKKQEHK